MYKYSTACAAAGIAMLLCPIAAVASADIVIETKGGTATADFSSVDASGCLTTAVHVEVAESTLKNPPADPQSNQSVGAFVTLSLVDACTGTESHSTGFTQDVLFQLNHRLSVATARGPITMCNDDGAGCFDTALDVTWVGTGNPIRINGADQSTSGGFRYVSQTVADIRLATASSELLAADGSNLTPDASTSAFIMWAVSRIVTISHL